MEYTESIYGEKKKKTHVLLYGYAPFFLNCESTTSWYLTPDTLSITSGREIVNTSTMSSLYFFIHFIKHQEAVLVEFFFSGGKAFFGFFKTFFFTFEACLCLRSLLLWRCFFLFFLDNWILHLMVEFEKKKKKKKKCVMIHFYKLFPPRLCWLRTETDQRTAETVQTS